ncbi:hypothetical protein [Streptomyces sp. OE57]
MLSLDINEATAESGVEVSDEPETTGTSPASTEQDTDPGEETGPAAA